MPSDSSRRESPKIEICEHWWQTVDEAGYGYVSICKSCGKRESAEHSQECFDRLAAKNWRESECICGATKEFEEYEKCRVTR
jgi:hypothetical protein